MKKFEKALIKKILPYLNYKPASDMLEAWLDDVFTQDIGEHNGWGYEISKWYTKSGNPEVIDVEDEVKAYYEETGGAWW